MKLSNYSLNYSRLLAARQMDIFRFLEICRELQLEGASLHVRDLESTQPDYLKKIRRHFLDNGLSLALLTVTTDFGKADHQPEFEKAVEALRVAAFLGAPLLRVFAGSPVAETERSATFQRAAGGLRKVCEAAAEWGIPVGLQNHNHGALCRTGDEVIRFMRNVNHANLTFVLDTGQFAGSRGASGAAPPELQSADPMESIRQTASLARYVRAKFYSPARDGSEPSIDYRKVVDIMDGVHYQGFIDIVYEPPQDGEDLRSALPRVVSFLRSVINSGAQSGSSQRRDARYGNLTPEKYFAAAEVRVENQLAFLEGPAVDRKGAVFFTNIPAEQILKWDPDAKKLSVIREKSNQANGLMFDREGRLVACEGGGRVTRMNVGTGKLEVLAAGYQGKPLGAPNDLTVDQRGRIYFTSRLANRDPQSGNVNAVYRIDPDGTTHRILAWPDIDMPNGIDTSPDDKRLYLIDADSGENRARRIRVYDLQPDGTATNGRLLYDFYPGRSGDGMAVDQEGNLYIAAGLHRRRATSETLHTRPGIHVITPTGNLAAFVETPEDTITNCAFGGPDWRTLYITCGKLLLSIRTQIPGKASYRPERG
ncbi:MAG TPA: SMP-30/gluconolactonase/LRE family protein [Acidobacteriota bacterium]